MKSAGPPGRLKFGHGDIAIGDVVWAARREGAARRKRIERGNHTGNRDQLFGPESRRRTQQAEDQGLVEARVGELHLPGIPPDEGALSRPPRYCINGC